MSYQKFAFTLVGGAAFAGSAFGPCVALASDPQAAGAVSHASVSVAQRVSGTTMGQARAVSPFSSNYFAARIGGSPTLNPGIFGTGTAAGTTSASAGSVATLSRT